MHRTHTCDTHTCHRYLLAGGILHGPSQPTAHDRSQPLTAAHLSPVARSMHPICTPLHPLHRAALSGTPPDTLASDDVVYVSGFWSNQVAMIHSNKDITVFAAGEGLDGPWGLAEWDGTLFVSSFATDSVHQYSIATGELVGRLGNELELDCPEGLAISPDGDLFVVYGHFLRHPFV